MPLPEFSNLAASQASRNLVNIVELDAWLDAIGKAKLGAGDRADKARGWLSTVAKKFMKKNGALLPISESLAQDLAKREPWAKTALDAGAELSALSLSDSESEQLKSILDWMRAAQGPAMASDWSRISWPQGLAAHDAWIDAMNKAALKALDDAKAFEGCELAVAIEGLPGFEEWRWVKVLTAEALDREGALMRHCAGSYAENVLEESTHIFSLRDPDGKPHLTVEALLPYDLSSGEGSYVQQLKSFGNAKASAQHIPAFLRLFDHFESMGAPVSGASHDLSSIGIYLTPIGLGKQKAWLRGSDADAAEALARFESLGPALSVPQAVNAHKFAVNLQSRSLLAALPSIFGPTLHQSVLADSSLDNPALTLAISMRALPVVAVVSARLSDEEAIQFSLRCMGQQVEAGHFGIRPSNSREELNLLLDKALRNGLPSSAEAALEALGRLPRDSFEGPEHEELRRQSYKASAAAISLVSAAVDDVGPKLSGPSFSEMENIYPVLRQSHAWTDLARFISTTPPASFLHAILFLRSSLARSSPRQCVGQDAPKWPDVSTNCKRSIGKAIAEYVLGDQRKLLLEALADLGSCSAPNLADLLPKHSFNTDPRRNPLSEARPRRFF